MKLVAPIKLLVNESQGAILRDTIERANTLCNWLSKCAWETQTFQQFDLHRLGYYDARTRSGLAAQMVVRCISKVANSYKLDRKRQRAFRPLGAIEYDRRLLSWQGTQVSLWTTSGRIKLTFTCGKHQRRLLESRTQAATLCYIRGVWILNVVCDVEEPIHSTPTDMLGVDLGVANIATTSDGNWYSGTEIETVRKKHHRIRRSLGKKMARCRKRSTRRNARRVIKRIGNREQRFRRQTNHAISKQIVARAKDTGRGIAIEDLKGIRDRTRFHKGQRAKMGGWAFHQLRSFLTYKAQLHGVPLVVVNPRNTSRTCSRCGHCEKANRPSQDRFQCLACDYKSHADVNAAVNIAAAGAAVNQPERPERPPLSMVGQVQV